MKKLQINPCLPAFILGIGILIWIFSGPLPARAGVLSFSKPRLLTTVSWSNGANPGVPSAGPEWLMVDHQGDIYLESEQNFNVYAPQGAYLKTLHPIDKSKNFFGFTTMEILPDGALGLLARLESPQEQWGKDNFEEHSKPGARWIILSPDGTVKLDKEETDPDQPHSNYYLENGVVYSVRDDGSYQTLESLDLRTPKDRSFGNFAAIAYNKERWLDHLQKLPVFHSGNKTYHDTKGNPHEVRGAASFLMGRPFVEGLGPLAERNGKIYYNVVCDKNQDFINAVFVEDSSRKDYGLVELFHSDENLDMAHGHTVFVDSKGDLFEGVGKKDGYRIYQWKAGQ